MTRKLIPRELKLLLVGSAIFHVLFVVALVLVSSLSMGAAPPPRMSFISTELVTLGKKRDPKLMPRLPAAVAPKPAARIPAAESKTAPKPTPTPRKSARDRLDEMRKVSSALDRARKASRHEAEGDPQGSAAGTTTDPTKTAIGRIYFVKLKTCMLNHWQVQGLSRKQTEGRRATIFLRIQPNGKLSDVEIRKGSGLAQYDRLVLRAVRRCGKISPPPEDLQEPLQRQGVAFEFAP